MIENKNDSQCNKKNITVLQHASLEIFKELIRTGKYNLNSGVLGAAELSVRAAKCLLNCAKDEK